MSTSSNQVIASAPASARDALALPGLAERALAELAAARARWPEASLTDAALATAIAGKLGDQRDLAAALARLRVEDLFLAQ